MTTASDQAAQLAAVTKALAQTDLATLLAAKAVLANPATTLAQTQAELAALPGALGDPDRVAVAAQFSGNVQALFNALDTLISQTNAAAGN